MTRTKNLAVALLALALPVGLAGCSQDSKSFERAVPAPAASTAPASSKPASAAPSASAGATSAAPRASAVAPTQQATATAQVTVTVQASSGSGEAGGESDGEGSDAGTRAGTWYRSSSGLYRSRQKVCVQLEETWQAAVSAGRKSASIKAHDDAILAGCDPAVWTPNGVKHRTVHESHYDKESCSESEAGTVAIFDDTYAVCTQQVEDVWTWEVAES